MTFQMCSQYVRVLNEKMPLEGLPSANFVPSLRNRLHLGLVCVGR